MSEFAKVLDVFFNGRRADPPRRRGRNKNDFMAELIRRKKSVVKFGDKLYRVTVEEARLEKGNVEATS